MKKKKWKERPLMLTDSLTLLSSASKYDTQLVTRENTKRHNERERERESLPSSFLMAKSE